MSQPSLNQSFDTSLLDITEARQSQEAAIDSSSSATTTQTSSFSSTHQPKTSLQATATATTTSSIPNCSTMKQIVHLPTVDAYDLWAPTYDTDGNILQALDTINIASTLLRRFLVCLASSLPEPPHPTAPLEPIHIVDLGCGTGRATLLFISALKDPYNVDVVYRLIRGPSSSHQTASRAIHITALDSSSGMRAIASQRIPAVQELTVPFPSSGQSQDRSEQPSRTTKLTVSFDAHDILNPSTTEPFSSAAKGFHTVHGIISTLVLEHIPLDTYFAHVASLLSPPATSIQKSLDRAPGGVALVTNMHADMGNHGKPMAPTEVPAHSSDHASSTALASTPRIPTAAGFTDAASGVKIRGVSYAHTAQQMVSAANAVGLRLVGSTPEAALEGLEEAAVTEEMVRMGDVGSRGAKWVGIRCWMGGVFIGEEEEA